MGYAVQYPFRSWWGDYRQHQIDCSTVCENTKQVDWNYAVGDKVLVWKDGILCKGKNKYLKDPWTITQEISIQSGTTSERPDIRQVTPFFEEE